MKLLNKRHTMKQIAAITYGGGRNWQAEVDHYKALGRLIFYGKFAVEVY